jgi:hypothetical protein
MPQGADHITEEVVGQRTGGLNTLLFENDRVRFAGPIQIGR